MNDGIVYYLRFCCRVCIGHMEVPWDYGDADAFTRSVLDVPYDELLATEAGNVALAGERHREFSPGQGHAWFRPTPGFNAHVAWLRGNKRGRPNVQRLLSTADACTYTGRTRQTLYRWSREGRIGSYRQAGALLWDAWELPPQHADGTVPNPPPKAP